VGIWVLAKYSPAPAPAPVAQTVSAAPVAAALPSAAALSTSALAGLGGPGSLAGGMGAALPTGAAAVAAPLAGAVPVLGLVAFAMSRAAAKKDPTADARSAQMIENDLQRLAKKTGEDKEAALIDIEEKVYNNPNYLALMNKAAFNPDLAFGAKATSGGTKVIGYAPGMKKVVAENQERLQKVVQEKAKAYQGVGGDQGAAPPPNPYVERKKQAKIKKIEAEIGRPLTTRDPMHPQFEGGVCLLNDMKVMLKNNNLINVNKLKVGDEIRTNSGITVIEEVLTNHMREGYYILNDELKITNDHPLLTSNNNWKKTEDVLIGDFVNGIRIDTSEYIFESTPTVSIVTQEDNYNVYCNDRHYTVHGNYALLFKQAA